MSDFTVTYNGRTPGEADSQLVTGVLLITATDALHALRKASTILYDDEDIREAQWLAFNFDIQPAEYE